MSYSSLHEEKAWQKIRLNGRMGMPMEELVRKGLPSIWRAQEERLRPIRERYARLAKQFSKIITGE